MIIIHVGLLRFFSTEKISFFGFFFCSKIRFFKFVTLNKQNINAEIIILQTGKLIIINRLSWMNIICHRRISSATYDSIHLPHMNSKIDFFGCRVMTISLKLPSPSSKNSCIETFQAQIMLKKHIFLKRWSWLRQYPGFLAHGFKIPSRVFELLTHTKVYFI
jgi:hypothetical protein